MLSQASRQEGIYWLSGLLLLWVVANVFQASFTELDPDEAYYWMYSQRLDWGYFDHPPAVAVLIRLGGLAADGELGVRLLFLLLQPLSFYFIWLLVGRPQEKREVITLVALLAAMPILQIYGFVATPDGPLLFFSALFFWLYHRYLEKGGWLNTVLLGASMAALLYSKYHGVLLIFFILLSNLSLLRRPSFYGASILGFLLFLPHLYWQYENGFPSFLYHLQGRDDAYQLKYTLTYLVNQMVLFSPFLFPLLLRALWKLPAAGAMARAYRFVLYGFWGFFFYTSFKGHVEPQWTGILSIPIVCILFRQSREAPRLGYWARRLSLLTIVILLAVRLEIAFNWAGIKSNFHCREWVYELKALSGEYPVLFHNSYRHPSKYAFYAGEPAYSFTDTDYRPNQFDVWDREKQIHNKTVWIAGQDSWKCEGCERVELAGKSFKLQLVDSLQVFQHLECLLPEGEEKKVWKAGQPVEMSTRWVNPYGHDVRFETGTLPLRIQALFLTKGVMVDSIPASTTYAGLVFPAGDTTPVGLTFTVPDTLAGPYQFGVGMSWETLPPSVKSKTLRVFIE